MQKVRYCLVSVLFVGSLAHASVDLNDVVRSEDFVASIDGKSTKVLRGQLVTDADVTVSSTSQLNTSWVRITHLGLAKIRSPT